MKVNTNTLTLKSGAPKIWVAIATLFIYLILTDFAYLWSIGLCLFEWILKKIEDSKRRCVFLIESCFDKDLGRIQKILTSAIGLGLHYSTEYKKG